MENIDVLKLGFRDFIEWVIIHSIVSTKEGSEKKFKDVKLDNLNVELKINGIEVPFMQTLRDIEKQLDEMIEKKAKELLLDKFGDLHNKIAEISNYFDENFNDMLRED